MKKPILFLLCLLFSFLLHAQFNVADVAGKYETDFNLTGPHLIKYQLTLNSNGTFEFHSYEKIELGSPNGQSRINERHLYGKGAWELDKKVVTLSSQTADLDEKFTLDLSDTKARFITKHPRNKSNKPVPTRLQFLSPKYFG